MIYRISFEPKGAFWKIQFQKFFFFWTTVTHRVTTGDGPTVKEEVLSFETYQQAEDRCTELGIPMAYHRTQTKGTVTAIMAGDMRPVSQAQSAS